MPDRARVLVVRRGSGANDFGGACAQYAVYYEAGADVVMSDFPNPAVTAGSS
ncbi:hypothetical protein [Streptomyces sp. Act143]|uniref:hypothetical protein n=1 Tax=Streptomyces sp. Act143 TaxID=2200760 RepID=UPI0015E80035|nr:hypothetical protein [Streptomyces sp. Act143]